VRKTKILEKAYYTSDNLVEAMDLSGMIGELKKIKYFQLHILKGMHRVLPTRSRPMEVVGGSKMTPSEATEEATMTKPVKDPKVNEKKTINREISRDSTKMANKGR
jgi:hypothetical protein